jgi:hypothetical protein
MNTCRKHGDENMVKIARKIYYRCRVCAAETRARKRARKKGLPPLTHPPTQDQIADRVYSVYMSCGHTNTYKISAPAEGERLYCRECTDYKQVLGVAVKRRETA